MTTAVDSFEVLHAVRVRGLADDDALARATGTDAETVRSVADALGGEGLLDHRDLKTRSGWLLTAAGHERHEAELASRRDDDLVAAVEEGYRGFLDVNGPFKDLCTDWQMADASDPGLIAEDLEALREGAAKAVLSAAAGARWFAPYADRLNAATEQFLGGDTRYLISPQLDSFHTVWAEAHEDFLVTLGKERGEEDGA